MKLALGLKAQLSRWEETDGRLGASWGPPCGAFELWRHCGPEQAHPGLGDLGSDEGNQIILSKGRPPVPMLSPGQVAVNCSHRHGLAAWRPDRFGVSRGPGRPPPRWPPAHSVTYTLPSLSPARPGALGQGASQPSLTDRNPALPRGDPRFGAPLFGSCSLSRPEMEELSHTCV